MQGTPQEADLESAGIGQEESEQIEKTKPSKEKSHLFSKVNSSIDDMGSKCMLKNVVTAIASPEFRVGGFWYEKGELKYRSKEMSSMVVIGNFWIEIKEEITHVLNFSPMQWISTFHDVSSRSLMIRFCSLQISVT